MIPTADYQTIRRQVNDWRGTVFVEVRQRRYERTENGSTVSVWVDQPVIDEVAVA